jgi:hypothetical protein
VNPKASSARSAKLATLINFILDGIRYSLALHAGDHAACTAYLAKMHEARTNEFKNTDQRRKSRVPPH